MSRTNFSMPLFLEKVRDRQSLNESEVRHFISNLKDFPDEQVSAFLAHVFHQPLSRQNKAHLTLAMRDSGVKLNWTGLNKPIVDKHSTGGIGDKISICLAPLLASLGMAVPTIMGRGLGFSGGTVDKLESISGLSLRLSADKIQQLVREFGMAFGAQSDDIAPADKKLYALRDVTATVESIPLITASILSKKLAESLDALVLDVKWGSGAFMSTLSNARELALSLVETAEEAGVKTRAFLTNMNQPLGLVSGNACEVVEALMILKNETSKSHKIADTRRLTLEFAASLLLQTGLEKSTEVALARAEAELDSGRPYEIFCRVVRAQGGDFESFEKTFSFLSQTKHHLVIRATNDGYIKSINGKSLGHALILGKAGREKQSDTIDHITSLEHPVKIGDFVSAGDVLCTMHLNHSDRLNDIQALLESAYQISSELVLPQPLIQEVLPL